MKSLKLFEEYIKEGIVRRAERNKERAKSLILEAERKTNSLKERVKKLGIKNENANDYLEYCYDIIMHLIRAKLYFDGYSTSGQGVHEAEVSYLRVLEFNEKDIQFIDQMRYFRNGILYYGISFDADYAKKVVKFTKRVYIKLRKILKEIK